MPRLNKGQLKALLEETIGKRIAPSTWYKYENLLKNCKYELSQQSIVIIGSCMKAERYSFFRALTFLKAQKVPEKFTDIVEMERFAYDLGVSPATFDRWRREAKIKFSCTKVSQAQYAQIISRLVPYQMRRCKATNEAEA